MPDFDLQQLEVLFYVLLGLVFVTLAVLIVYVVLANRQQRKKMVQAYEEDRLAPRAALQLTGQLLALVRDEPGSMVQVEVDGARYRRLSDIKDPQLKRQVVEAVMELVRFTGALGHEAATPPPVDKALGWREDLRKKSRAELERVQSPPPAPPTGPPAPPAGAALEERFLNLLSELGQVPSTPEKPSLTSALQQRWSPRAQRPERPRSFVDDIEEIVQRRMQLIPALASRDLHVRLGSRGTVCFAFEGQEYEQADDIPNLTARQLVKDAIHEWDETA